MKTICLTGGLASGKSTASKFLEEKGAYVIDADKLGHRVYEPGTQGYLKVIEAFGEDIVGADNHIDRKKLGGIVFGNPEQLKRLTDIVWPEIRRIAELEIDSYGMLEPEGTVVLEAAVLFEAGWEDVGDSVWVLVVEREIAIARAMARDNVEREAVEGRLNSQLSNEERAARADVVITNNGTQAELLAQLEAAWAG
ncbi:MAG: dephospho-CoA kinase [Pseudomonadota bacterium]